MKNLTIIGAIVAATALALTGCAAGTTSTEPTTAADAPIDAPVLTLGITDAWVKSAEAGAMTAAFGIVENLTSEDVTIVGATTPATEWVELHETVDDGTGAMKMREIEGGFVIPAGTTFTLEPGGNHIMFMGLPETLVAGSEVEIVLELSNGSTVEFTAPVKDFSGANEEYEGDMGHGEDAHDHGEHEH